MVEVQGTDPWSKMFITSFVYLYSWKTNINNINFNFKIFMLVKLLSKYWIVRIKNNFINNSPKIFFIKCF